MSYYGKLADYQVYGRQIGSRPSQHDKDLESLSWFYAQGPQDQPLAPPREKTRNPNWPASWMPGEEFGLDRTWDLPNGKSVVSVTVGSKTCPLPSRL